MKVYIGPYKNWWGPYQIANLIPFLSEDTKENIGCWLSQTRFNDLCNWYYSKNERKIKVRIDKYDTWNMNTTLAHIILPMLKQLQASKHGSQLVDDEDVPPHMRHSDPDPECYGADNWVHYKWEWVLNEMIWAFEQELDDDWEDQFIHGDPQYEWELVGGNEDDESAVYRQHQLNPDYWVDREGIKEYNARIQNGFRLFGKYYSGLWD
jgi:hypothetical protein